MQRLAQLRRGSAKSSFALQGQGGAKHSKGKEGIAAAKLGQAKLRHCMDLMCEAVAERRRRNNAKRRQSSGLTRTEETSKGKAVIGIAKEMHGVAGQCEGVAEDSVGKAKQCKARAKRRKAKQRQSKARRSTATVKQNMAMHDGCKVAQSMALRRRSWAGFA